MYSCDMRSYTSCCKQRLLHPFMTLQQDDSKVSVYDLEYICTVLELLFYSESNDVIFNFVGQHNRKLWPYI